MESKILKRTLFIGLFISVALILPAAETDSNNVSLQIQEAERRIYTVDTPVVLQINLKNESADPYLFELAGNKLFNLKLEVTNLYNEAIPASEEYIRERGSNQQVYYRELRLLPGEEFSFYSDLSSYVKVPEPGIYFVKADFMPHLGQKASLSSNTLTLYIQPSGADNSTGTERIAFEKRQVLQREQLPPDRIVFYTIQARQKEEWEKFFLYLDVEQLLLQNSLQAARYRHSSEEERVNMVNTYRELLENEVVDEDILLQPSDFRILKTEYTPEKAEVLVEEDFSYPGFTETRRYMYYLHRPEGYWIIYNYQVMGQETSR